jgi:parvulin-like peptidyl-prolyl isomerase
MLMRQMRQNTKIIMLLTAIAFVALMVFQWGMDVSGRGAAGNLGRVGGRSVSVLEWQNAYRSLYDQISQSQSQPVSSQQNREIEDMAWDQVVNEILIQREISRRGIRVTDDEILQAARFSPPPQFQFDPAFQNEQGQFDLALYQRFLTQPGQDLFLNQLDLYYRDLLPQNKLLRQVTSGIFVPDGELWEQWRERNDEVSVTFVAVSPDDRVSDDRVTVTEEEVERYYRENPDEFEVPARAQVLYAYIDKAPTAADSADALAYAAGIRQEIMDGADFAEVATRESIDEASALQGGLLGPFGSGMMVPVFDSLAFSLPVGEISAPLETDFGYHIVEVLSRDEDAEVVEARHILLPIALTDAAEVRLLTRADSLETLAQNRPLPEAAMEFGLTVREAEIAEDFATLPGVGVVSEGQDWVFVEDEAAGLVSPVFETDEAFYIVELVDESPAGRLNLDQVAQEIREDLQAERKVELTIEEAKGWAAEVRSGSQTMEDLAERLGTELRTEGPFTRQDFVPGLGQSSPAVGATFGTGVGGVAEPVATLGQVVILRVDDRSEADRETWEAQRETQRTQVTASIQQARLDQWLEGLRTTVNVLDNRAEYFRTAEEQAAQGPQVPMFF